MKRKEPEKLITKAAITRAALRLSLPAYARELAFKVLHDMEQKVRPLSNKERIDAVDASCIPPRLATSIRNLKVGEAIGVDPARRSTIGAAILYFRQQGIKRKFTTRKKGDRLIVLRLK